MDDGATPVDWQVVWSALNDLKGGAYAVEIRRLDKLWRAEYQRIFQAFALSRAWTEEAAGYWSTKLAATAPHGDHDFVMPREVAIVDVFECEWEGVGG